MSNRTEPVGYRCPKCGAERVNPEAEHPSDGFRTIIYQVAPKVCDACTASTVFIVVCEDRHIDPKITVHRTRAGADARVEAFVDSYGDAYEWTEDLVEGWERSVVTEGGDGPKARIQSSEIEA